MPLPFVFDLKGYNGNPKPESTPSSKVINGDHTAEEREVAGILIHLLYHKGPVFRSNHRCCERSSSDQGFPMWSKKRKRSAPAWSSLCNPNGSGDAGEPFPSSDLDNPLLSSHSSLSAGKENRFVPDLKNTESSATKPDCCYEYRMREVKHRPLERTVWDAKSRQIRVLGWPDEESKPWWRPEREFLLPDLNLSAEDVLTAADAEMRIKQQQEVCERRWRKVAAAGARKRRRQLLRLKNSLHTDGSLWPRVRG